MNKSMQRFILAMLAMTLGVIIVLTLMWVEIPDKNRESFNLLAGLALAWGGTSMGFYFGTSQSSADKTELLQKKD